MPNSKHFFGHSLIYENTFPFPWLPTQFKPNFLKGALTGLQMRTAEPSNIIKPRDYICYCLKTLILGVIFFSENSKTKIGTYI